MSTNTFHRHENTGDTGFSDEYAHTKRHTPLNMLRSLALNGSPLTTEQARAIRERKDLLATADPELVREELLTLLQGRFAHEALLEYGDVFAAIIPEISAALSFDQRSPWHQYDVWEHTCMAIAAAPNGDELVYLALLFHDLGKPVCFSVDAEGRGHFYGHARIGAQIAQRRLQALHFDQESIDIVCELISLHLEDLQAEKADRFLFRLGETQLRRLLAVQRADSLAHHEDAIPARLAKLDAFTEAFVKALDDSEERAYC